MSSPALGRYTLEEWQTPPLGQYASGQNAGKLYTYMADAESNTRDHERDDLHNVNREENAKDDPRLVIDYPNTENHCHCNHGY